MNRTPMARGSGFKRKTALAQPRPERVTLWPVAQEIRSQSAIQKIASACIPQPKQPRAENKHLLAMARGRECLIRSPICTGGTETTVACHGGGVARGKGMGYKVGDQYTAWGCHNCNHYTDAYGAASKAQKEAAFMAGHLRQVLAWRQIAGNAAAPARDKKAAAWALELLGAVPDRSNQWLDQ